MGARHQAGPSRCRRTHPFDRGGLSLLAAHQGVPDCRLLSAKAQGRVHEDHARAEADHCWTAHPLQGVCCCRRLRRSCRLGRQMQQGGCWGHLVSCIFGLFGSFFTSCFIIDIADIIDVYYPIPPLYCYRFFSSQHLQLFIDINESNHRGAIILAKLSTVPVRRGYWGSVLGEPHTVPAKVSGKCGSVTSRLVPAPRGTGIVASPVGRKLIGMAGIQDCYTTTCGSTKTQGNFLKATFQAIANTYSFLTPDLWAENKFSQGPYEKFSHVLAKSAKKL